MDLNQQQEFLRLQGVQDQLAQCTHIETASARHPVVSSCISYLSTRPASKVSLKFRQVILERKRQHSLKGNWDFCGGV